MNESLAARNPTLEAYNLQLRQFDTAEEKLLQQEGQATYPARLAQRRKELKAAAALPPCPITSDQPNREVSGYSLSQAVARIPGMPRTDRAVLRVLADHYNPQKKTAWPSVDTVAGLVPCSDRSVQNSLTRLQDAKYTAVQTGDDRKGDSRLRPDKPRAGGRAKTTRWLLNVNGIFKLACPENDGKLEKAEVLSPFEPAEAEKGETTTQKGATTTVKGEVVSENPEATTLKGEVVAPDPSNYPNIESKREQIQKKVRSNAASVEPSDSLSRSATNPNRKTSTQRLWVQKIWKDEHDTTVIATPEDTARLEEYVAKHGEPILIHAWHCYVTERTHDENEDYAHYSVVPVQHVVKKVSKAGKPYFDTATSTAEITRRPFRAFLAPDVVQSFIDRAKLEEPKRLETFAANYVKSNEED